jgi:chemotaxis family two-component system sensor kinase Cph1
MNVDITNCDREPIHIPGFVQPHGVLFALQEPDLTILQASANTESFFDRDAAQLQGQPIGDVLDAASFASLSQTLRDGLVGTTPLHIFNTVVGGTELYGLAHRYDGILILELERAVKDGAVSFQNLYSLVGGAITRLEAAPTSQDLCEIAVREMRLLTGLDKVMVYLFDEEWNGLVVAEDRADDMDAYLGLRFPASDIPRQARDLYLRNKLRLISDVYATPVVIAPNPNPLTGRSLDMSYSTLRSVSPIHIEYLKNMGVGASMSVSIVREGRLAGLFACHHRTPKFLSFEVKTACEFLGQVLALQLAARERAEVRERKIRSVAINSTLLESMTRFDNYAEGLAEKETTLLELTGATGAAICVGDGCILLGQTPDADEVAKIAAWAASQKKEVLATQSLSAEMETAESVRDTACGLLAISTSGVHDHTILWFRPEVVHTVSWAGNPHKPVDPRSQQLHPRESFKVWKEMVNLQARPWDAIDIEAATELRAAIVGIVLRQAEERAQLSTELMHSNQELEAFSYSVSHDLRAPFRHILGFADLLSKRLGSNIDPVSTRYLTTITDSAHYAGTLVDNLLTFSQMGRAEMRHSRVNLGTLVQEIRTGLAAEIGERRVEWKVDELPTVRGDLAMLRLVVQNLLSNAVKYTRGKDPATIEIGCHSEGREWIFTVRDNGVGFDMAYSHKLFGVFQRLHRSEEFEGTGIGLANTRRIISRHGGRTWAEGVVDEGATFGFSLPITPLEPQVGEKI